MDHRTLTAQMRDMSISFSETGDESGFILYCVGSRCDGIADDDGAEILWTLAHSVSLDKLESTMLALAHDSLAPWNRDGALFVELQILRARTSPHNYTGDSILSSQLCC